jgi:hypothetical protein
MAKIIQQQASLGTCFRNVKAAGSQKWITQRWIAPASIDFARGRLCPVSAGLWRELVVRGLDSPEDMARRVY